MARSICPTPIASSTASGDRAGAEDPYSGRASESQLGGRVHVFMRIGPLSTVNEKYYKNDVAFWNEMMKHPDYDEWWQARNLRPHLKNIRPAVMTGLADGWLDAEDLFGALEVYKSIEKQSPGSNNTLVMGPWFHGGWGGAQRRWRAL